MAVVYRKIEWARQLHTRLSGDAMDFALLVVSSKIKSLKSLQREDLKKLKRPETPVSLPL